MLRMPVGWEILEVTASCDRDRESNHPLDGSKKKLIWVGGRGGGCVGAGGTGGEVGDDHGSGERDGSETGEQAEKEQEAADRFNATDKRGMKAGSGDAERFEEAGGTIKIREFSLARQEERPADGDACEEEDGRLFRRVRDFPQGGEIHERVWEREPPVFERSRRPRFLIRRCLFPKNS